MTGSAVIGDTVDVDEKNPSNLFGTAGVVDIGLDACELCTVALPSECVSSTIVDEADNDFVWALSVAVIMGWILSELLLLRSRMGFVVKFLFAPDLTRGLVIDISEMVDFASPSALAGPGSTYIFASGFARSAGRDRVD